MVGSNIGNGMNVTYPYHSPQTIVVIRFIFLLTVKPRYSRVWGLGLPNLKPHNPILLEIDYSTNLGGGKPCCDMVCRMEESTRHGYGQRTNEDESKYKIMNKDGKMETKIHF